MTGARHATWGLLLVAACYHPSYDRLACGPNGECPRGLTCSAQQVCERGDGGVGVDVDAPGAPGIDAAPPLQFLSCAGLAATCGASGTDSCCTSFAVPGGTYYRSYDKANDPNSGAMSFRATVSDLRLDKYDVTVGRFRVFVNAGMGTQANPPMANAGAHAKIPRSGWDITWKTNLVAGKTQLLMALQCDQTFQTWTDTPGGNENRPMNCVSWYEALAFCAWDGGYLPTEAEWNYVSAGGDQQRAYPWSTATDPLTLDRFHASYGDGSGDCYGDGVTGCALTDIVKVGTKPMGDGRWGQSDLSGNVWKWMLDWDGAYPSPCTDCANLTPAPDRVLRGGSFYNGIFGVRTAFRYSTSPARYYNIGVRCARSP